MTEWWLSSDRMTVWVRTNDKGVVDGAAPVVWRFIGQPLGNLRRWMRRQGGYVEKVLAEPEKSGQ